MKIHFEIEYRTIYGEEIQVCGSLPALADESTQLGMPLSTNDGLRWYGTLEADLPESGVVEYSYILVQRGDAHERTDDRVLRREWQDMPRRIYLRSNEKEREYHIVDTWRDVPENRIFFTAPFVSHNTHSAAQSVRTFSRSLLLQVPVANLPDAYTLGVLGNCTALGNWQDGSFLSLNPANRPVWHIELDADTLPHSIEYKFVLIDKRTNQIALWEENNNRCLSIQGIAPAETLIIEEPQPRFALPQWKGAGVAIPLFSLRSKASWGMGDFADLKLLIDWAVQTGLKFIQLLPINDTTLTNTWRDSYPYNAISVFALHPIYIAPSLLPKLKDKALQADLEKTAKQLERHSELQYQEVSINKYKYLYHLYRQDGEATMATQGYLRFAEENAAWLSDYADFCVQRDRKQKEKFLKEMSADGDFYIYIQYLLHRQLSAMADYARDKGISLKGDIPIGVNRHGADAVAQPHLFNMDTQTGAPPDAFATHGQNWGFPTYNWQAMQQEGFEWWRSRFVAMAKYFDAYRIDHILGFFRIWEIPLHSIRGLLGQFSPALPLSANDIEAYGLKFRRKDFTQPYIDDELLQKLFGKQAKEMKLMLKACADGRYALYAKHSTQHKIAKLSPSLPENIREALMTMTEQVLFVADHRQPDRYHPRINGHETAAYRSLTREEQEAYSRLHDDFFYRRHNDFWQQCAMQKLPALVYATALLPCGEDLGMIPASVPRVMQKLQILSLEIERMPKGREEFGNPYNYPYNSVSALSTHDTSTLRGWWEEDYARSSRYYTEVLHRTGTPPRTLDPHLCEAILRHQLCGNSILCILNLQDWLSINPIGHQRPALKERINIPADPNNNWNYRLHLPLEALLNTPTLTNQITQLLSISGR